MAIGKLLKKGGPLPARGEGSAKDMAEDKKLAKARGMSMAQWERSAADKKHDAPQAMKKGGVAKYAKGGGVEVKGKTKGKLV